MKKTNTFYILAVTFSMVCMMLQPALAADITMDDAVTRGEVVSRSVKAFELADKEKDFVVSCLNNLGECFFVFTGMSRFSIIFEPFLILYPDVREANNYYEDINLATMLGIVHGYIDDKESPFRPNVRMTKMEALKVIMGAGDYIKWQEKFELVASLGGEDKVEAQQTSFEDVNGAGDHWWYPRYVNMALDKGIIESAKKFNPDEFITREEFENMLDRAQKVAKLEQDNVQAEVKSKVEPIVDQVQPEGKTETSTQSQ